MKYRICNANSSVSLTINNKRGEYFDMHRQTQNHIYAILINSFLLLFHEKKKKKRRNMFTIFLQTNLYPKKKMA